MDNKGIVLIGVILAKNSGNSTALKEFRKLENEFRMSVGTGDGNINEFQKGVYKPENGLYVKGFKVLSIKDLKVADISVNKYKSIFGDKYILEDLGKLSNLWGLCRFDYGRTPDLVLPAYDSDGYSYLEIGLYKDRDYIRVNCKSTNGDVDIFVNIKDFSVNCLYNGLIIHNGSNDSGLKLNFYEFYIETSNSMYGDSILNKYKDHKKKSGLDVYGVGMSVELNALSDLDYSVKIPNNIEGLSISYYHNPRNGLTKHEIVIPSSVGGIVLGNNIDEGGLCELRDKTTFIISKGCECDVTRDLTDLLGFKKYRNYYLDYFIHGLESVDFDKLSKQILELEKLKVVYKD